MKWIRLFEASYYLDTSASCIVVTACQIKKTKGAYPIWYKNDGRKSFVDIDYLLELRAKEMDLYHLSCDLFYFLTEDMNILRSKLAVKLAESSEIFNKEKSWLSFMSTTLFSEPIKRFNDKPTRLQEFYQICTKIKEEYMCQKKFIES